jgi:hypothetical protein
MSEIKLYTTKGAAEYTGLYLSVIKYNIHETGALKPINPGGRQLMFTQEELDNFMANRIKPGPKPKKPKVDKPRGKGGRPPKNPAEKWRMVGSWGSFHPVPGDMTRSHRFYRLENALGEQYYFADLRYTAPDGTRFVKRRVKLLPYEDGPEASFNKARALAATFTPESADITD